jgi:putative ABC transport system permease protein
MSEDPDPADPIRERTSPMNDVARHLRHALRGLRKSPAFTAVALITLALGIGATTAVFSVIDGVLLRPLPFEDPEELFFVSERSSQLEGMSVSYPNFQDFRDRHETLEGIAAYNYKGLSWTGGDRPELLIAGRVSAGIFPVLGVEPLLGRTFTADEDRVSGPRVAVLSHHFWRERLGADPDVVGTTLRFDDEPYQVAGVMPAGFRFPPFRTEVELWVPIEQWAEEWLESRGSHPGIYLVGRRADGVSLEEARADLDRVAAALAQEYPDTNTDHGVTVTALHEEVVGDVRPALLVLAGAVGLVLLIACANVANLMLVRSAARRRDLAVRTALGAGRWPLVRQALSESLILGVGGGALGLGVALAGREALLAVAAQEVPRLAQTGLDLRVLGFALGISLATGLLFGLAPAVLGTRGDLAGSLKEGGRGSVGAGRHRARNLLVVAEMGLALMLLAGAGLMLRTLGNLLSESPGIEVENVLTADLLLAPARYSDEVSQAAFQSRLLERLEALPGAVSAAAVMPLPLSMNGWQTSYFAEGKPHPAHGEEPLTEIARVSAGYHETLGIPLVRGRYFTEADREGSVPVAIVDETFAELEWPGEDPLGKRVRLGGHDGENPWLEIVGVVGHVKNYGVDQESRRELYIPFAQSPLASMTVAVRTAGDPEALAGPLRDAVLSLDPDQPLASVQTLESYRSGGITERRLASQLLGIFAAVALLLAAVGIYGVMASTVAERTHEIGLRMALGARGGQVRRLVVGRGMALAGIGVAAGLAGALGVARLLESLLYGVSPADPATLAAVPVLLAAVALVACWLPARRASAVDPMVTLRSE